MGQKPDTFVFIGLPPEGAGSITNLSCDVSAPQTLRSHSAEDILKKKCAKVHRYN
jgi:hypothetical protein